MPLINKIEISNIMNSRRQEPWRPDWTYQQFDLKGENTAINMPNGRGKSTLVLAILAMLIHDKSLHELRKNHFAPQSTGCFSHIRIETYIWAEDNSPVDLVVQSGGDTGGAPMVFGVYGNSGENVPFKLYAYRGSLEDCPIGRRDGNKITLTPNPMFLDTLSAMPGCFPTTHRDGSRANWREYVASFFDIPSIEQQLVYQKASGAEGSRGYFHVEVPRGKTYAETVFYERLAPELLVDMMGSIEEYADERGIEDIIHQKVQGIIKAKVRTAKTADDLEKTKRVLEELERVKEKADTVIGAKADKETKAIEFSHHYCALKAIVVDAPIPGLLHQPPEEMAFLICFMVMQDGVWYLPDRAFAVFTGEKPSHINERARRNRIQSETVKKMQLIDFICDPGFFVTERSHGGGTPPNLYSFDSAKMLLAATTNFVPSYTREKAISLLEKAYEWVEASADTNPARLEFHKLKEMRAEADAIRKDLAQKRDTLQQEISQLKNEQQQVGLQQAEYRHMSESGLFTEVELQSPARTGEKVTKAFESADLSLNSHRQTVSQNKASYLEWLDFSSKHGEDADPAEYAEMLVQTKENAQEDVDRNKKELDEVKGCLALLKRDVERDNAKHKVLLEKSQKIDKLRPYVQLFIKRFGDTTPDGLLQQVRQEFTDAEKRLAYIASERLRISDALSALQIFIAAQGTDTNPKEWLESRAEERNRLTVEILSNRERMTDLKVRRADLDKAAVAAGKVAREVLEIAGADAKPLHAVIEDIGLDHARKERVLSMFSALLFSPVYDSPSRAAEVAKTLASKGIESPVFVLSEFVEYCLSVNIIYDDVVARTWLVGVRTRPVDCLLDPTMVEREKALLDNQIDNLNKTLIAKQERLSTLDPESNEAVIARKANEALKNSFPARDQELQLEESRLMEKLPYFKDRASDEAQDSIRATIEYQHVLGELSEEQLTGLLASAQEAIDISIEKLAESERFIEKLSDKRESLQKALNGASVQAAEIPKLKRIDAFIKVDGPAFMKSADEREAQLLANKQAEEKRKAFRFDLAEIFINSGENRPQEIEFRLSSVIPELTDIVKNQIPALDKKTCDLGENMQNLQGMIVEIDGVTRNLRKKYRELQEGNGIPTIISTEKPSIHPLIEAAQKVYCASSMEETIQALLALGTPLDDIDTANIRYGLKNACENLQSTQNNLSKEIERVKADSTIALNEQMRIGLDNSKENINALVQMITATKDNYDKSLAANKMARTHLDHEWNDLGSWLENFTRRLPSNFETMRSVFKPVRDSVSGMVVSAGFEIDARVADIKDVRVVLNGIVEKIESMEKRRELLDRDGSSYSHNEKNTVLRKIKEEFYKSVLLEPMIRVCIPSISHKPLKLESRMASSGQGVAMTLLWIVKMADYVTERELQKQTVSNAARRKIRSMRTQFVFIDGAFSHLSDRRLIADALEGVKKTRGKFQLIITGHDPNYTNDFLYFPSYIVAREIGGNFMYAKSETRRLLSPEEVGLYIGAMEITSVNKLQEMAK